MNKIGKLHTTLLMLALALTITSFVLLKEEFSFSKNLELKGIKQLNSDIAMNGGTLQISTHLSSIAEFKSQYTKANWKAEINLDSKKKHFIIHQPKGKSSDMRDNDKNNWQIKIPKDLATDFKIKIGGGEGNIDLSNSKVTTMGFDYGGGSFNLNLANTPLSDLNVNGGAGALVIDLSGKHTKNIKASINGVAGSIKLFFPNLSGVRVQMQGAGIIDQEGFKKQGGYYVNKLYGKSAFNIDVKVNSGFSTVELRLK